MRPVVRLQTFSEQETARIAEIIGQKLAAGGRVALIGELGAGKTVFARGLVRGLGGNEADVCSPTYVIAHEYIGRVPIVHVDAYRLRGDDDTLGLDAIAHNAVVIVEWPERAGPELRGILGTKAIVVRLQHAPEGSRLIEISLPTAFAASDGGGALSRLGMEFAPVGEAAARFSTGRDLMADLQGWLTGRYGIPGAPTDAPDSDAQTDDA